MAHAERAFTGTLATHDPSAETDALAQKFNALPPKRKAAVTMIGTAAILGGMLAAGAQFAAEAARMQTNLAKT